MTRPARGILAVGSILSILSVLSLAVPLACSGGKKRGQREVLLETEAHDEKVGQDVAEQVRQQMGMVDRPDLAAYLDKIGHRLLRYAPRRGFQYSFDLIDQDAPNAFALPGGAIFVSRGLMVLANSEDELANVLGHEIIHVAARHAAARQAIGRNLPGLFQFYAMKEIAAYGRDQEREADRLGQGLSALAGYDPKGLMTFMRDLEYTERLMLGMSRLPSFMDTHPVTSERVASSGARARVIQWKRVPPIAGDRDGYLRTVEGLTVGQSASQGIIIGERFFHPDLGISLRFPDRWQILNTPQAVGAFPPKRDAQVFMEFQGLGLDPRLSAEEFLKTATQQGFKLQQAGPVKIGGFDAWRAEGRASTRGGGLNIVFTFISYKSTIYRITGVALDRRYMPAFLNVARSFRELTPAQRGKVRERRLRIVIAREGESLAAMNKRTGNTWNVQQTAIMNDLFANQKLKGGQLVKVALAEEYTGKPAR